jgi:PDZ domain-containing protein
MNTHATRWMRLGGSVLAVALAVPAWAQLPGVGDVKGALEPAAGAVKQAVPRAGEAVPDAAGKARQPVRDAVKGARDATKGARDAAKEAADEAPRAAADAVKGARREGKEAIREGREAVREGREAVREGVREGREAVREGRELSADSVRSADLGLWFDAGASAEGLVIADIAAQGAISKIGFQEGDRIVSINGTPVRTEADFTRLFLADDIRNERVKVIVFRGGREQILYVQPALIYQEVVAYDPFWQYGLVIDDRYPDRIVILRVYPRTPAYYAGLRAGDVITSLGGQRITAVADFSRALSSADGRVALQVNRANRTRELALDTSAVVEGRTRTSLRPDIDAEGRVEGRPEGRVEGRTEGRTEGRVEGKAKGRVEEPAKEGEDDVPAPRPRLEKQPKVEKPAAETPRLEKPEIEIPDVPEPAPKAPAAPKAPGAPKSPKVPSDPKF